MVTEFACASDPECPDDRFCLGGVCVDPCPILTPCSGALKGGVCVSKDHRPVCECPSGTIANSDAKLCIPYNGTETGCQHEERLYAVDEVRYSDKCQEQCRCGSDGTFSCGPVTCPPGLFLAGQHSQQEMCIELRNRPETDECCVVVACANSLARPSLLTSPVLSRPSLGVEEHDGQQLQVLRGRKAGPGIPSPITGEEYQKQLKELEVEVNKKHEKKKTTDVKESEQHKQGGSDAVAVVGDAVEEAVDAPVTEVVTELGTLAGEEEVTTPPWDVEGSVQETVDEVTEAEGFTTLMPTTQEEEQVRDGEDAALVLEYDDTGDLVHRITVHERVEVVTQPATLEEETSTPPTQQEEETSLAREGKKAPDDANVTQDEPTDTESIKLLEAKGGSGALKVVEVTHNSSTVVLPSSKGGEVYYKAAEGNEWLRVMVESGQDSLVLKGLHPSTQYTLKWSGVCRVGNETYAIGHNWAQGCQERCSCRPGGVVDCQPRCIFAAGDITNPQCEERPAPEDPECCVVYDCKSDESDITGTVASGAQENAGLPKLLVTAKTHNSVTLAWDDFRARTYKGGYVAEYREEPADPATGIVVEQPWMRKEVPPGELPPKLTVEGLRPNTLYEVRVSIYDDVEEGRLGEATETINVKTEAGCVYGNSSHSVGEFYNGCEERCMCVATGDVQCFERCTLPYFRAGSFRGDPLCSEHPDERDECCVTVRCASDRREAYNQCTNVVCGQNAECISGTMASKDLRLSDIDSDLTLGYCRCLKGFTDPSAGHKEGSCTFKNSTYRSGDVFHDECDYRCSCSNNSEIECEPRCEFPHEDGSQTEPGCEYIPDPKDHCCKLRVCNSTSEAATDAARAPSLPSDGCTEGNITYARDEKFYNGCETSCTCLGFGDVSCTPRCPPLKVVSATPKRCDTLPDPLDTCCSITVCDAETPDVMKANITELEKKMMKMNMTDMEKEMKMKEMMMNMTGAEKEALMNISKIERIPNDMDAMMPEEDIATTVMPEKEMLIHLNEHTHDDGTTHSHPHEHGMDETLNHTDHDGQAHDHDKNGQQAHNNHDIFTGIHNHTHTHENGVTHTHPHEHNMDNMHDHEHNMNDTHTHEDGTTHSHPHDHAMDHTHDNDTHTHEDGTTHSHPHDRTMDHTHDNDTHTHEDVGMNSTHNQEHDMNETHNHTHMWDGVSHIHPGGQEMDEDHNHTHVDSLAEGNEHTHEDGVTHFHAHEDSNHTHMPEDGINDFHNHTSINILEKKNRAEDLGTHDLNILEVMAVNSTTVMIRLDVSNSVMNQIQSSDDQHFMVLYSPDSLIWPERKIPVSEVEVGPAHLGCVAGMQFMEETECGRQCMCQANGQVTCKPRCPRVEVPQDSITSCTLVPSPDDPCCTVPDCLLNLFNHNVLLNSENLTNNPRVNFNTGSMDHINQPNNAHEHENVLMMSKPKDGNQDSSRISQSILVEATDDAKPTSETRDKHVNITDSHHPAKNTLIPEDQVASGRPLKSFISLNDLLNKHNQLGSVPHNTSAVSHRQDENSDINRNITKETSHGFPNTLNKITSSRHNASFILTEGIRNTESTREKSSLAISENEFEHLSDTQDHKTLHLLSADANVSSNTSSVLPPDEIGTHVPNDDREDNPPYLPDSVNENEVGSSTNKGETPHSTLFDNHQLTLSPSDDGIKSNLSFGLPDNDSIDNITPTTNVEISHSIITQNNSDFLTDEHDSAFSSSDFEENSHLPIDGREGSILPNEEEENIYDTHEDNVYLPHQKEGNSHLPTDDEVNLYLLNEHGVHPDLADGHTENLHLKENRPKEQRPDSYLPSTNGKLPHHPASIEATVVTEEELLAPVSNKTIIKDGTDGVDIDTSKMCSRNGRHYKPGQDFFEDCASFCICKEDMKIHCAAIECPVNFGLDLKDPNCLEWDQDPHYVPTPPKCCPQVKCIMTSACVYMGQTFNNYDEIPRELTGCSQECSCNYGNVTCRDLCAPVPSIPPPELNCEPQNAVLITLPGETCCRSWQCAAHSGVGTLVSFPVPPGSEMSDTHTSGFVPIAHPVNPILGADGIAEPYVTPLDARNVHFFFSTPKHYQGLPGELLIRFTNDPVSQADPSTWSQEILVPMGSIISQSEWDHLLTGLQPSTVYSMQVVLTVHGTEPVTSPVITYTTMEEATPPPTTTPLPRLDINAELYASEITKTTAKVSWRGFDDFELHYIDGVQVKYTEKDKLIPKFSQLFHRDNDQMDLRGLQPGHSYTVDLVFITHENQTTQVSNTKPITFTTLPEEDPYAFEIEVTAGKVASQTAELFYSGVPEPEEKYINVYRAVYLREDERVDAESFKVPKTGHEKKILLHELKPDVEYQVWIEAYLSNGRKKKSNVLTITTRAGQLPKPERSEVDPSTKESKDSEGYYPALVAVAIIAAIACLGFLGLLIILLRKQSHAKAHINSARNNAAYDNPSYKVGDNTYDMEMNGIKGSGNGATHMEEP
ncbi:epidermal cell surface receptor-like [Homarus americanus]|uniref:Epidermal cell surface receptor-like n=1 Tax=Homarus americanus TaxID=6706 RepID=A0A8J5JPX5_HOMAM|nr:epidermal cell surface receptor-like [Homarus americanus]